MAWQEKLMLCGLPCRGSAESVLRLLALIVHSRVGPRRIMREELEEFRDFGDRRVETAWQGLQNRIVQLESDAAAPPAAAAAMVSPAAAAVASHAPARADTGGGKPVIHEGWLVKTWDNQKVKFGKEEKRFFVLRGDSLCYYKTYEEGKTGAEATGKNRLALSDLTLIPRDPGKKKEKPNFKIRWRFEQSDQVLIAVTKRSHS